LLQLSNGGNGLLKTARRHRYHHGPFIVQNHAIPQFTAYKKKGYRTDLQANLKNAYTSAQGYLSDVPSGTISTEDVLTRFGFKRSPSVSFGSADISMTSGSIILTHEALPSGSQTGTVDYQGVITLPAQ
jgi:hypothetical protein